MKMKRRRTFAALMVGMLFFCSVSCYGAETTTYDLEELGLSIELSDQLYVFTRDMPADDPGYEKCGLEKEAMDDLMESGNIYLNAIPQTLEYEIVVTKIHSELKDFRLWSDNALEIMTTSIEDEYEKAGYTFIDSELYAYPQAKFVKIYLSQKSGDLEVYGLQYYTVYDNQAINITLHSYTGKWEEKYEERLKTVVDSIDFWKIEEEKKSDPFPYTYTKTGLQFTVPAGWKEKPLSKEREHLVAKFLPTEEDGDSILFGCSDYWSELPAADRRGYTRAELDNSLLTELRKELTEEEFAALFFGDGFQVEKISTVSYGGREYIKMVAQETVSVYGMEISATATNLLRVENGYLYTFQFSGTDTSWHYPDFEALLNSVSYPTVDVPASRSSPDSSGVVISLVAGGTLVTVLLFVLKFMPGPKKKEEKTNVQIPHRSTPPITSVREKPPELKQKSEPGHVCRWCGKPIPKDSCYCPHCGEKLEGGEETS